MRASLAPLYAVCFIMLLGIVTVSCSGGRSPTLPNGNNHDTSSSDTSGNRESAAPFEVAPGYPHKSDIPDYAEGEVLVVFSDSFIPIDESGKILPGSQIALDSFLQTYGLSVIKPIRTDWAMVYRLKITDGKSVEEKIAELKTLPEVEIAGPNGRVHFLQPPYVPNDPLWENPNDTDTDPRTNAFEQFGPSKTGASYVWDDTKGEGSVVCVIDTGTQVWHEDLSPSMWHNEDEIPSNGIDDDSNGYIDDIYGWDTSDDNADITDTGGGSYHGTACAGVVAATMDNNVGCTGMAPGAKIMGIRIAFSGAFYSGVIEGVQYAIDNGADIISMSFITTDNDDTMRNTMDAAYAAGLVLVGGAGNNEGQYIYYPCSWDNTVKVGATSPFSQAYAYAPIDEERLSVANGFGWGSTYSNGQELMAFGEHYITTFGGGADQYWDGTDDFFFGGTSNATPMVAGAFALLKGYFPGETAEWYRIRMRDTADDLMAVGYDNQCGYGRINLIRAIYGADRYSAEEDINGFVDIAPHSEFVVDSINAIPSGNYIDNQDLYKFAAPGDGNLAADLNIFTYGKDLDLQIYSHPSLAPEFLVGQATGSNHAADTHEVAGADNVSTGETYYFKVYGSPGSGAATSYDLSVKLLQQTLSIETGSLNPGFVHQQKNNVPVGWIDFDAGYIVNISEVIISQLGILPTNTLAGIHLYRDSNGTKNLEVADALIASRSFNGTNRAVIDGFSEEINFLISPVRFFITIDLSGITEDTTYQLALTSYKDIATEEGVEVDYDQFPRYFGPFQVGVDTEPPTWNSTVGVQDADPMYGAAQLYWNGATDPLTPPVKYNVYWTDTLPFNFTTANHQDGVNPSAGGSYNYKWKLSGLTNDHEYFVAVRTEDQAGNEDANTVYLSVTPTMISDPYNPQVVGSYNTQGNAWEVKSDPANQRVFVADYNGGVRILDVSDPTAPTLAGVVSGSAVSGIDFDGTYVYAAGAAGVMIINPDGPGGPQLITTVPFSYALDVQFYNDFVYATNDATHLLPIDVTDPENPITYTTVTSGDTGYGMDAQNGYLYVATNTQPKVFDLSDPTAPVNTGADFGGNNAYEIDAMGDRLYVTYWYSDKFSIYSLADPAQPVEIGQRIAQNGVDGSDITLFKGRLYFGLNNRHIEVLNVDNPANIWRYSYLQTNGPDGLDSDDNFIYSAENEDGLKIIL